MGTTRFACGVGAWTRLSQPCMGCNFVCLSFSTLATFSEASRSFALVCPIRNTESPKKKVDKLLCKHAMVDLALCCALANGGCSARWKTYFDWRMAREFLALLLYARRLFKCQHEYRMALASPHASSSCYSDSRGWWVVVLEKGGKVCCSTRRTATLIHPWQVQL